MHFVLMARGHRIVRKKSVWKASKTDKEVQGDEKDPEVREVFDC